MRTTIRDIDGVPHKPCPECKRVLPLTTEFWARAKARKGGFAGWCKECHYARRNVEERREASLRYARKRWRDDPESMRAQTRRWRAENRETWLAWARNHEAQRRTRMLAVSDVTPAYARSLLAEAKDCPLCGVHLTAAPRQPNSREVDHIVPVAAGGTHTIGNLRVICRACNGSRPHDGSDVVGQTTLWAFAPVT